MAGKIDAAICERIIDNVTAKCSAPSATPLEHGGISGADALASIAVAIAIATAVLGVLTISAAIGWLFYVRHRTKMEAKAEVEKIAPEQVRAYLDANVPGMVSEIMAQISAAPSQETDAGLTPDQQAEALGEDPR